MTAKNLLAPVHYIVATIAIFELFAASVSFPTGSRLMLMARPVAARRCPASTPWTPREALAVRYDAGVADASASGITPSWVRTVAKSQYSLSRWISPSSASSRTEATRTSTCCPVPGGSGPNCPL